MNFEHDDELLSAYLDQELSEAERARLEQTLADRPESRRLLEELQALRASLTELPRHAAPEGFAETVLQRTARQSPNASSRPATDTARLDQADGLSPRSRFLRPVAYVALAAVASLLILLFFPDEPRQVALHDRQPDDVQQNANESERLPKVADHGADDPFVAPKIGAAPPDKSAIVEGAEILDLSGEDPQLFDSATLATAPESASSTAAPLGDLHLSDSLNGLARIARTEQDGNGIDGLLVVMCEVSPDALADESFEKILVGQQIAIEEEDELARKPQTGEAVRSDVAERAAASRLARPESPPVSGRKESGELPEVVDVVYVEAAPAQLQETLIRLATQRDKFLHVAVEPTPGVDEAPRWRGYSYGDGAIQGRVFQDNQAFVQTMTQSREGFGGGAGGSASGGIPAENASQPNDDSDDGKIAKNASAEELSESNRFAKRDAVSPPDPSAPQAGGMKSLDRGRAIRLVPSLAGPSEKQLVTQQLQSKLRRDFQFEAKAEQPPATRPGNTAAADRAPGDSRSLDEAAAARSAEPPPQRALFVFKLATPPPAADPQTEPPADDAER